MSATPDPADYVTVEVAGKLAGISPRTLRYWIRAGKLSAIAGKRGKFVLAEEVHALAVRAGKAPGAFLVARSWRGRACGLPPTGAGAG